MLRSGCDRAGCLQGNGPPQQLVDHRPGGGFELRETRVHIASLKVRPEDSRRDMDRRANRSKLKLYRRFAKLLDAASARGTAIAHEGSRLAVPLRINPVERILEHRSRAKVIFGRDEDETGLTARFRLSIS